MRQDVSAQVGVPPEVLLTEVTEIGHDIGVGHQVQLEGLAVRERPAAQRALADSFLEEKKSYF